MSARLEPLRGVPTATGTRWQRVLKDCDWHVPLRELGARHFYCVYLWWRRAGWDAPGAVLATQACFARWLTEARPSPDQPKAERLREWLPLQLAKLSDQVRKLTASAEIPFDAAEAEREYADEPPGEPNTVFARRWALTLLESTAKTMRAEYTARGEERLFADLLPFAGYTAAGEEDYIEAAARTGLTLGSLHLAAFEFRKRQREILLGLAADTLSDPAEAEHELTALLGACDAPGPAAAAAPLPSAIGSVRPDEMLARAMQSVRMTGGSHNWQAPSIEEAARLFPQYEILSLLGRGGMGAVYKGRQPALDRFVAIKLLPMEVSADHDFAERFRREARAMAKLQHPNIVGVHDFGTTSEGHLFFVMEFVEGANLHEMIHGPGISAQQSLKIIIGVCDALHYAHAKGVVHRDIKPANVMVSVEGHVKVADFGLARLIDPGAERLGQTMSGVIMGTPDYMAPEQKRGQQVDHRADIYSLGVMLYEMLCREVPQGIFDPPSARVGCDTRVDQVVIKAMQQQPARRYQSTQEMKTDVWAVNPPSGIDSGPEARGILPPPLKSRAKALRPLWAGLAAAGLGAGLATAAFLHFSSQKPGCPQTAADSSGATDSAMAESGPTALAATKEHPFVNSLGMQFVPVAIAGGPAEGGRVLFSVWDTRVQDYTPFVAETKREWPPADFEQGPAHPAVNVSWEDAHQFCRWLTARDQAAGRLPANWRYRLPSDYEWSCAAEIGSREDPASLPSEKSGKITDAFPWGAKWPPPSGAGNYASEELRPLLAEGEYSYVKDVITGYSDGYVNTSPVGSFAPSRLGLYDLGGNVWQWCEDWYDQEKKERVQRGGSWSNSGRVYLLSSNRAHNEHSTRGHNVGFRCVAAPAATAPASPAPAE